MFYRKGVILEMISHSGDSYVMCLRGKVRREAFDA